VGGDLYTERFVENAWVPKRLPQMIHFFFPNCDFWSDFQIFIRIHQHYQQKKNYLLNDFRGKLDIFV